MRPIQVGSHYHFFETNSTLKFDRTLARGMRLHVPSGNAVRFEPGEVKSVELVTFGGNQIIYGFHNQIDGRIIKVETKWRNNFKSAICPATYGPTVGDKVRLGDTNLWATIEQIY